MDLQIFAPPVEDNMWPGVGEWPASARSFTDRVQGVLAEIGRAKRLAFGAILSLPTEDKLGGYRILEAGTRDLGLHLPDDASDFMLQINRPVASRRGPKGLTLNRLAKWSVSLTAPLWFTFTVSPESKEPKATALGGEAGFALRLELDFSTPADWAGELVGDEMQIIMGEMVEVADNYVSERLGA
jgi:hypothetical protein